MIPDRCRFCKGKLRDGKTEFLAHAAGEVIVIKDVPAYVCDQCGEAYYTAEISRKIDGGIRALTRKNCACARFPPVKCH
jgi:YgiT-type zinc finger domain-containing protein